MHSKYLTYILEYGCIYGMRTISRERFDGLAEFGSFQPSGLNDGERVDMREGRPFHAIDRVHSPQIDDAIRVQKQPDGGYMVQVALADVGQLSDKPDLINRAIDRRETKHKISNRKTDGILPPNIVAELELIEGDQRALVVTRRYTQDMEPDGEVEITPALVSVVNSSEREFSLDCLRSEVGRKPNDPFIGFQVRFRRDRDLPILSAQEYKEAENLTGYSKGLVDGYMVLADMAIAQWATEAGVPIIHRSLKAGRSVLDRFIGNGRVGGRYSADAEIPDSSVLDVMPEASAGYTRATAGFKRAADLINQLQIASSLAGVKLPYSYQDLRALSEHLNPYEAATPRSTSIREATSGGAELGNSALARVARGWKLQKMFQKLAVFGEHPLIDLPVGTGGAIVPRYVIARSKELGDNVKELGRFRLNGSYLYDMVTGENPELKEGLDLIADGVDLHEDNQGNHYLSIIFDRKGDSKLYSERAASWQTIEDKTDSGELEWGSHDPNILIAIMRAGTPPSAIRSLTNFVKSQLPMEVRLDPLHDPREQLRVV